MKKQLSFALAVILLFQLLIMPAAAAESGGSMENFVRTSVYDDTFQDISETDWYYENVTALYELGLTTGSTDSEFAPEDTVTVAEVLAFAARVRSIYEYGDPETGSAGYAKTTDTLWYAAYVRYLSSAGVIGSEFSGQYDVAATRGQVAFVLANVLPEDCFEEINADAVDMAMTSSRLMADVTEETAFYTSILKLYRWGIVSGSDAYGTYYPESSITRAELAAMLTRLVGASEKVTLDWSWADAVSAAGTTYASLVIGSHQFYASPTTEEEIESDIWYMIANDMSSVTLNYGEGNLTREEASWVNQTFLDILVEHPELMYNKVIMTSVISKGVLYIEFGSTCIENTSVLAGRRQYALDSAIAIHDQLWSDGSLTKDMTDLEKAKVYFDWICENCTYDYDLQVLSHTSYSVFAGGIAVCDGYTGAYNLLLRLEGIDCTSATIGETDADRHMWTVAVLDGVTYHIDTTWGDSEEPPNYQYFAMTPEESMEIHTRNAAYSGGQLPE